MSANCGVIAGAIEKLAPTRLAESWDNVGLLVGRPDREVNKALLSLDVTTSVAYEAAEMGAGMIITHHPFPFHSIKCIRTDTMPGALLEMLLKNGISVYVAHTNLDAASGGVNDALAQALQLQKVSPLLPVLQPLVKIVTYVPTEKVESVWKAMSEAGAGHIGKYSQCGFRVKGMGTFLPSEEAHPYIGEPNQLSKVDEVRIETVAPAALSASVVKAMVEAHPYEEAAYDVYSLQNERINGGMGRVGELAEPMTLFDFGQCVKAALGLQGVRLVGPADKMLQRAAVCGGAGMDFSEAARRAGAQVLVTGDIRYHDAQDALAEGLCLVDAGHFGTEFPVLFQLQDYLRGCSGREGWDCTFEISRSHIDVWQWI